MAYLDNTFGIEIECYLPEGGTQAAAAVAITERTGLPCAVEGYNHITRSHWKIVTDGSLGDYIRGVEFVSPILTGETGLVATEKVMRTLTDYGCTVSRKCGLHVHVGAAYAPVQFFRNIFKLYALYEPVIDRFMPASRRQSLCNYARSITNVPLSSIDTAEDLNSIIGLMRMAGVDPRFHKLNLAAHRRHQTVEFRQHSGTLEGNKVRNWAVMCMRMVERAKSELIIGNSVTTTTTGGQRNRAKYGTKAWEIGQMLLRPEGVTPDEVRRMTGWPSVSMPQQLRTCGLSYTTQRMGRQIRYFSAQATAVGTNITIDTSLDGLFDMIGCDEAERTYFRERTANLSGTVQWAA